MVHNISHSPLTIAQIRNLMENQPQLNLSEEVKEAIVKCRNYLDKKMEDIGRPVYGVTTGFGSLCNFTITS